MLFTNDTISYYTKNINTNIWEIYGKIKFHRLFKKMINHKDFKHLSDFNVKSIMYKKYTEVLKIFHFHLHKHLHNLKNLRENLILINIIRDQYLKLIS